MDAQIKEYLNQYKDFETLKIEGITLNEIFVDYFPNGTTGFMKDTSEIFMNYLREKIET